MNKVILILTFLVVSICPKLSNAQNYSIFGQLQDSSNYVSVDYAVVSLLDSSNQLLGFKRTLNEGKFVFENIEAGNYSLIVEHPLYTTITQRINLIGTINFGKINMISLDNLLNEVVISAGMPIVIKGDTIEYIADSFRVKENANVEELLKQLPGLQIDKEGKIQAQGQTVQRVLVDGEEFFGEDPTMATRNIEAKAVDAVQVYDAQSEDADFSGVDDGERTKTVNIKLKDDYKKGYFGKIYAASGAGEQLNYAQDYSLMVNSFKKNRKMSVYSTYSNVGVNGLNWQENRKFGGDAGSRRSWEDGVMYNFSTNQETYGSSYRGEGIPLVSYSGAHYSNKWNNKHKFNLNYRFRYTELEMSEESTGSNILSDSSFNNYDKKSAKSFNQRHYINGNYEWSIDSFTEIEARFNIYQNFQDLSNSLINGLNEQSGDSISFNDRNFKMNSEALQFDNEIYLKRKFRKDRRSIFLQFNSSGENKNQVGQLIGSNLIRFKGNPTYNNIDQNNDEKVNDFKYGVFVKYTEPLNKHWTLSTQYSFSQNSNQLARFSYENFNESPDFGQRIDSLSNDFKINQDINEGGISLNYLNDKVRLILTGKVNYSQFQQRDLINNRNFDYNQVQWLPQIRYRYKFSKYKSFRVNYSGYTNQPTPFQIQPIVNNNDPLNLYLGNTNLKQAFAQNMDFNFFNYSPLDGKSLWMGLFLRNEINGINLTRNILETGIRENIYENLNGFFSASLYGGYYFKTKLDFLALNVGINSSFNRSPSKVNNELNNTTSLSLQPELGASLSFNENLEIDLNFEPSYVINRNSLQDQLNNNYWVLSPSLEIIYEFLKKYSFETDVNYNYQQAVAPFNSSFERLIINASFARNFLKKENLIFKLSVNDLLNQNRGYNRSAFAGNISEREFLTISRFFLFSLTYNFNKTGGQSNGQN